jgi:uncharacterized membrane protein
VNTPPPIPRPALTTIDWVLELLAACGVLLLLATTMYYLPRLPPEVPSHFGFDGVPDAVGGRWNYLALPGMALCVYAVLTLMAQRPQWLNYPHPVTAANATDAYRWMRVFLALLKNEIVWMLGVISAQMARIALGQADRLGGGIVPFLVVVIGTVGAYAVISKRRWGSVGRGDG